MPATTGCCPCILLNNCCSRACAQEVRLSNHLPFHSAILPALVCTRRRSLGRGLHLSDQGGVHSQVQGGFQSSLRSHRDE